MAGRISKNDAKTILLSSLGSALEYYDFTVFIYLTVVISEVFFPPEVPEFLRLAQTFVIFSLGYFVRPIGGIVIAHFGDRVGRKKMFMFSIFLMAVPTLAIGLLPTYAQAGWIAPALLLLMRLLQGFALAGELPGAIVFVSEHADRRRIGFSCAVLMGTLYVGLALGSATSGMLTYFFADKAAMNSIGWRLPFILGGVFGLVSVYLRRYLQETPLFVQLREEKQLSKTLPIVEVIKDYFPSCLFVIGLSLCLSQVNVILFQYLPTLFVKSYGFSAQTVFWASTSAILVYALMNPVWGWIGDMVGRGRALGAGAILTVIGVIWMFSRIPAIAAGEASLVVTWCAVGVAAGFVGLAASLGASVFPTKVRLTGFSFPYNISAAIGAGSSPLLLTWLVQTYGRGAPAYLAVFACVGFICLSIVSGRLRFYLADVGTGIHPVANSAQPLRS